jgi:signal transduction histidine kinase
VTGAGLIAVVVTLSFTNSFLHDRAREAGLGPPPPPPAETASAAASAPVPADTPGVTPVPAGAAAGQIAADRERLNRGADVASSVIHDARLIGIATVVGLAVVSLGLGWWLAGTMMRPIGRLTRVAAEVSGGRFGDRIESSGRPDELGLLIDTFNAMLDRLDTAFDAQRSFSADASHELRTPLAVMRTEIDVAIDDPTASTTELRDALLAMRDEVDRATRLVESLLSLARSQTLTAVSDVDLAEIVERVRVAHPLLGLRVHTQLEPTAVRGDATLLERLIANLLSNVERYTPAGGDVSITTRLDSQRALVEVENAGPILSDEDVANALRRFHRRPGGDGAVRADARGGLHVSHGVGLAVVQSIAQAHGAVLHARPRAEGGLRAVVSFPASIPTREPAAVL